jgi:nucleotide-binding universal stress UspA family protein
VSYKTIAVHLDNGRQSAVRLELGLALATMFDAYLIGVFALNAPYIPSAIAVEAGPVLLDIEEKRRAEAEQRSRRQFEGIVGGRPGRAEWRSYGSGDPVGAMTMTARYADLLVIGQFDPDNYEADGVPAYFTEDVVLGAGKPVLIVPYAGQFTEVGQRALVAWSPAREASRALWDGLPLLKRSNEVEVASFERGKTVSEILVVAREELGRYLELHSVKAKVTRVAYEDLDVGDAILAEVGNIDGDVIVMGAYGHSRLRERVLGGATRTVLKSMTVPVLMSH